MSDLAKRRELKANGIVLERTPLLVPSFSSRVPEIEKIFRTCEEFIDGPILISAYDVGKGHILPPFDFPPLVFLDSGGYEVSKEPDLSDVSGELPTDTEWSDDDYSQVLTQWNVNIPSVVITYDHPKLRVPLKDQIERALKLRIPQGASRELLLKPETKGQNFHKIETLVAHAREFANFDVIGITEKEIGNSVFDRMKHIAELRLALRSVGLEIPIHVFGSLDTITTLFYFVAGADIFDGLTWLRYGFKDGNTLYKQNFGIIEISCSTKSPAIEAMCWAKNYSYIKDMQSEMRRFLKQHDFEVFTHHHKLLAAAFKNVEEELEA